MFSITQRNFIDSKPFPFSLIDFFDCRTGKPKPFKIQSFRRIQTVISTIIFVFCACMSDKTLKSISKTSGRSLDRLQSKQPRVRLTFGTMLYRKEFFLFARLSASGQSDMFNCIETETCLKSFFLATL